MARMTRPDCVVMCNFINTHTHVQSMLTIQRVPVLATGTFFFVCVCSVFHMFVVLPHRGRRNVQHPRGRAETAAVRARSRSPVRAGDPDLQVSTLNYIYTLECSLFKSSSSHRLALRTPTDTNNTYTVV